MSTGDETRAGLPPSQPPRRPPGTGGPSAVDEEPKLFGSFGTDDGGDRLGAGPELGSAESMDRFFEATTNDEGTVRRTGSQPKILAPHANEWEEGNEIEVVRNRRPGLILLFLLALFAVAIIALGLALVSAFGGGGDTADGSGAEVTIDEAVDDGLAGDGLGGAESNTEGDITGQAGGEDPLGAVDPNALQVVLTEEPFICDGDTRPFAQLSGATPNEQIDFSSPQSSGLSPGTADGDGVLPMRWQCDPEQAGTVWEVTATGAMSAKTVTFIFAGALAADGGNDGTTATTTATPEALTVNLIENPFVCNGETRVFGNLSGAMPDEQIRFSSPQSAALSSGTADSDGATPIRWSCDPDQVGTVWELTATGATSGRSVTFNLTGS